MGILIYVGLAIGIYVISFKNDFPQEELEKTAPFIIIICIIFVFMGILTSL